MYSRAEGDGLQFYQEIIGSLRWAVELGRVDILLEVSLISKHLALPREGHLEQALIIALCKGTQEDENIIRMWISKGKRTLVHKLRLF